MGDAIIIDDLWLSAQHQARTLLATLNALAKSNRAVDAQWNDDAQFIETMSDLGLLHGALEYLVSHAMPQGEG